MSLEFHTQHHNDARVPIDITATKVVEEPPVGGSRFAGSSWLLAFVCHGRRQRATVHLGRDFNENFRERKLPRAKKSGSPEGSRN